MRYVAYRRCMLGSPREEVVWRPTRLLLHAGELMQLIGGVRSDLFHYEVRCTYANPEIADHRRLVDEARIPDEGNWEPTGWSPDDEEKEW